MLEERHWVDRYVMALVTFRVVAGNTYGDCKTFENAAYTADLVDVLGSHTYTAECMTRSTRDAAHAVMAIIVSCFVSVSMFAMLWTRVIVLSKSLSYKV